MENHQTQRVCVSGFILNNEGKFLIVKRADDDDFLPGWWELPGGGTDFGEDIVEAVLREIKEECGIEAKMLFPAFVSSYMNDAQPNKQYIEIFFVCKMFEGQEVKISYEHSDFKWVNFEDLKNYEITEYILKVLSYIEEHLLSHPKISTH